MRMVSRPVALLTTGSSRAATRAEARCIAIPIAKGTIKKISSGFSVLAQRPERARAMLVGTARPAEAAVRDHPFAQILATLRARRRCTDIVLEYLSRTDVAAYVQRRFDGSRVAEDVATLVHAHTDGNPLFMVALVDHLLARGWLTEDGGLWRLTAAL